ncbi:ABC transporter substrate-binding protein [Streptomyces sp.]|uniref:ABC transporter substrate-binding protein n=1 Tax=Streptomyces sp. TaxID=1931 RepID=UPI002F3F4CF2
MRRHVPALAALLLSVLTACTAVGDPAAVRGEVTGRIEPHEITWLNSRPSDGPVIQAVRQVAAAYAKSHPGFRLNIVSTPDRPSYLQKVSTLAGAKKLPELFDTDPTPFAEKLRKQDRVVDVGGLLDEFGATGDFRRLALDYQRFDDGGLYAVPLEFAMEYFWFNKEAFTRARIAPPRSLDEFTDSCAALRKAGYVPIALDGKDGWPLERYLSYYPFRLAANDFVNHLKSDDAAMTDRPGRAGAEFIAKLGKAGCFAKGFSSADYTSAMDLFTTGRAAMINIGTWELGTLATEKTPEAVRDDIDYFTLPTTEDSVTASNDYVISSGIGMAVNADTFDPLVKDFLKYLVQHYPAIYAALGQLSPTENVRTPLPDNATPLYQRVLEEADRVGDQTVKPWDAVLDPTTNTIVQQNLPLLAQGDMSPEAFQDGVDQAVQANSPRYFPK